MRTTTIYQYLSLRRPRQCCFFSSGRVWDPTAYDAFRDARTKPAMDLLHGCIAIMPIIASSSASASSPASPPSSHHKIIWDLGCGSGTMLPILRNNVFSDAASTTIHAVDSSRTMLETAKHRVLQYASADNKDDQKNSIVFHNTDIETFVENNATRRRTFQPQDPPQPQADLIYSNAALHWLPALQLQPVLTKLYTDCLKPGGILAFQIPDSRLQPSHLVLDELVAATVDDLDDFVFSSSFRTVRVPRNEVDMEVYHTLFSSLMDNNNKNNNGDGKSCDSNRTNNTKDDTTTKHDKNNSSNNNIAIWTTTYLHPLPYYASAGASTAAASTSRRTTTTSTNTTQNNSSNHHPHPVYDFYASTGLGPFLEACIDEQEKETFIARYNQRMFDCYPVVCDTTADHKSSSGTQKKDDGTVFLEVTRLFVTVRKPEEKGRQ